MKVVVAMDSFKESLTGGLGGKMQAVEVTGPDGKKVQAEYGILPDRM